MRRMAMVLGLSLVVGCGGDEAAGEADATDNATTSSDGAGDGTGGDSGDDAGESTGDAGESTGDAGESTGDAGDSTGDAGQSTGDAGESTGDAGGSTGSEWDDLDPGLLGSACTKNHLFAIEADALVLDGWEVTESQFEGEGIVAYPPEGAAADSSATLQIDIPCDGQWAVWVRALDETTNDSYFVAVDGQPDPPLIFEVDCANEGESYRWAELNQRGLDAAVCEYVTPRWRQDWDAGEHEVRFFPREPGAISRIVVTNDLSYDPDAIQ